MQIFIINEWIFQIQKPIEIRIKQFHNFSIYEEIMQQNFAILDQSLTRIEFQREFHAKLFFNDF